MKWYWAVLVTAGILGLTLAAPPYAGFAVVLATALWAAVDSARRELKKYRSGIATGPVVLFIGVALLWFIGFPWYLVVRGKIRAGTMPLKSASAAGTAKTGAVAATHNTES
ncbi:MAG: hypothetical protein AB1601_12735 [Planctomycetota bacterium]